MVLYKLFSCNLEVQYKSYFLSKAMLFTIITTLLNIVLPFIVANRSRGFWLKTESFFEQPSVHFTYDYLLVLETEDPSAPIVCGDTAGLSTFFIHDDENCAEFAIQEHSCIDEHRNCLLDFKFLVNIPSERTVTSAIMILGLDFQLKSVCPLHMQSLAVINKEFAVPPSSYKYYGDLQFYQINQLSCPKNIIDTQYNNSLMYYKNLPNENVVDFILRKYFNREVTTQLKMIHSRAQNGHTGTMNLDIHIRVPQMEVQYTPSLLQELKWAWPQYLSLLVVLYWVFNRIKRFVFNNRLLMAWEVMPWRK